MSESSSEVQRCVLRGSTFPVKDRLSSYGFLWHPERRVWFSEWNCPDDLVTRMVKRLADVEISWEPINNVSWHDELSFL